MSKTPLLFLCHRIPYPPNKGDKIRSFHLLHHLAEHFDIYLATFVDDPADLPYVKEVEKYCVDSLCLELAPRSATIRSLRGFLTGDALSVPYYTSREMTAWVEKAVKSSGIKHVIVYSSAMAQFVTGLGAVFSRKVIDFVDVDSDKWQQYAKQKSWPMNWLYQREADKLLALEKQLARQFDAGLFVSSAEAELFKQLSPETSDKIGFYNNGVNAEYFDPALNHDNPYKNEEKVLVFTGAMDYWPNIDAVVWFCEHVFTQLRVQFPKMQFYIVGGNPATKVNRLATQAGVTVTGRVEDIRPYVRYATVAVAPMRVARGIQNKVLEAMAMETPVMVSAKGLEGIQADHEVQLFITEEPADYRHYVAEILSGRHAHVGKTARLYVEKNFNWDENLPEVVLLLNGDGSNVSDKQPRVLDV